MSTQIDADKTGREAEGEQYVDVNDALGIGPIQPTVREARAQTKPETPAARIAQGQEVIAPQELEALRQQKPPQKVGPEVEQPKALVLNDLAVEGYPLPSRSLVYRATTISVVVGISGTIVVYYAAAAGPVAVPTGGVAAITGLTVGTALWFNHRGWSKYFTGIESLIGEVVKAANEGFATARNAYTTAVELLNQGYKRLVRKIERKLERDLQSKQEEIEKAKGSATRRGDEEFQEVMGDSLFAYGGLVPKKGVVQRYSIDDSGNEKVEPVDLLKPDFFRRGKAYINMMYGGRPYAFKLPSGTWLVQGRILLVIDGEHEIVLAAMRQQDGSFDLEDASADKAPDVQFEVEGVSFVASFHSRTAHREFMRLSGDIFFYGREFEESETIVTTVPKAGIDKALARAAEKKKLVRGARGGSMQVS